uniref:Uncharacterized protein n=1 Tax=Solanum lycopersicum TaxID=4081 RepID=A0A3Q7GZ42_SOLLC
MDPATTERLSQINQRILNVENERRESQQTLHAFLEHVPAVFHINKPLPARARMDRAREARRGWMSERLKESVQTQESTFLYEHSVHVSVRGRVKGSPLLRIAVSLIMIE